jgi:hypothetical protein
MDATDSAFIEVHFKEFA